MHPPPPNTCTVELAGIFNALGVDTHLFVRFDGPLRSFDSILRETLTKEMAASGAWVRKRRRGGLT